MSVSAASFAAAVPLRLSARAALVLCACVVLALSLPMFLAPAAHLSSDESLYLAEAYNIAHGEGPTYPSGDAIDHRAPLFPAMLAPFVRLAGPDAAYWATKAIVAINALLVALLAFRMGGALAASVAGIAAGGAAYLNGLGTTLYLDPFQCAFLLLAVAALHEAWRERRTRWFVAAGFLTGVAFLVKESAVQWAPLGVLAWLMLPSLRNIDGARGALLFALSLGVAVTPWYAWVWTHGGGLYLVGDLTPSMMLMLFAGALTFVMLSLAVATWHRAPRALTARASAIAAPAAATIVAGWCAVVLYGLTAYSGWPYPSDYVSNVPRYMTSVAPQAQPYLLLLLAWCWVAWAALRRDGGARLLAAAALLFLPFALFAANRGLQLRDALPILYLSYVALGIAAAHAVRSLTAALSHRMAEPALVALLVALGAAFAVQQAAKFEAVSDDAAALRDGPQSWDNAFMRENAGWLEANLPEGSSILSSRLYFSSIHVLTDARFSIHQLPTVRVDIDLAREGMLAPRSNLFRWGEHVVRPHRPGDDWIYLRQFPGKGYWIGLSQQELIEYVAAREVDYVTITGDDMTFSSLAHAMYFSRHPAFELIRHDRQSPHEQFFVYRVDRERLGYIDVPLMTSASSLEALQMETGLPRSALEHRIGQRIRISNLEAGLSAEEEAATVR